MLFELRRRDGSIDPHSSGTLAPVAGQPRRLDPADFTLTPGRRWTSPVSGGAYPVEWQIRLPSEKLDLTIKPVLDAQELVGMRTGIQYWEGAIDIEGTRTGIRFAAVAMWSSPATPAARSATCCVDSCSNGRRFATREPRLPRQRRPSTA
jgi:predicted secreted hydrolase